MKKRKILFSGWLLLLTVIVSINAIAQKNFKYKANLGEVTQSSFYKIPLPPEIIAKCNAGLIDVRVLDNNNNQTAYLIKQDAASFSENSFIEFPIISKTKEADKQTHITIENKTGKAIEDVLLITKNLDAKRVVNISGSNDLKEWYIIKEGVYLDNYFSAKEEELVQSISLPLVNYKYFQITIIGKDILPFNISKAGIYSTNYIQGKYSKINAPIILQKDSTDKKSYISLKFNEAYHIDKLNIEVEGPKFFRRNTSIYFDNFHSTKTPYTFFISSNFTDAFLPSVPSKELLLLINNEDNQPLKIKSANAYQLNQYLLTYLEAGKKYQLVFGDSLAEAPVYDLNFFKDSIGKNPPELTITSIEATNTVNAPAIAQPKSNKSNILLWCIIGATVVLLLLFTFKMVKDVNKRAQS